MAKKFDMNKMMRGKSLSDAADNIENMTEETAESLEDLLAEPRKDKVTKAVVAIRRDALLPDADKKTLIDALRAQFSGLFNLKNCPDDYESLKHESIFLSELTQVSFLLLGQRLMKIRDNELYRIDGYDDFKTFVTEEVKIARSTAYNYIDLVSVFGVQTFGRANAPDPSKLIPLLPLLKSKNENIPVDKIKSQFVKEAQNHSARDIKEKAQELKVKYGLAKEPEEVDRLERAFNSLVSALPDKLTASDKKKIRKYIDHLNSLLGNK